MKSFPFEERDFQKSRELYEGSHIGEVLFSEGTYQIEVKGEKSHWPFLQLDDEGSLLDSFCTCKSAEDADSCPHLGAAFLAIFKGRSEPLHVRFRRSLWNLLCQMAARRHGYDASAVKVTGDALFQCTSLTNKVLFTLKTKNEKGQKAIQALFFQRVLETEETSLKFSNLPSEEIALWRQGRPSEHLKYELSFWSDLAKMLFMKAERGEKYQISFHDGPLPKEIRIAFKEFVLSFYIARVNWPELIPALVTVESPLIVQECQEVIIQKMSYDEKSQTLSIASEASAPTKLENRTEPAEEVGDYLYYENVGFFTKSADPLLMQKEIGPDQIQELLSKHPLVVKKYLKETSIHIDKHPSSYSLHIDLKGDLTIKLYLFTPGDLDQPYAAHFGPWVYLPHKGFYLLDGLLFEGVVKRIPRKEVGDFVTRHRLWLNEFEGFQTHLFGVEAHLQYRVDESGNLHFTSANGFFNETHELIDYGDWIYIRERGFYTKLGAKKISTLKPGSTIPKEAVPQFIRSHREDLEQIEGFFATHSPVAKSGLHIYLSESGLVTIDPLFNYHVDYRDKSLLLFEEFVFVVGEGFSEIPTGLRLPADYQKRYTIDRRAESYFITYELPQLAPYILEMDPRLERPTKLKLKLHELSKSRTEAEWLADISCHSSIGGVDLYTLWEALRAKKTYILSDAGLIWLADGRFNWLKSLPKRRFSKDRRRLKLTALDWVRLTALETIELPSGKNATDKRTLKRVQEISSFDVHETPDTSGLKTILRPYQEIGVKWLWSLYSHGISALLCDEMGLGKTHQAMALIAAILNRHPGKKVLVVCPTSVIYHWEDLLKRFMPTVRTLIYYGVSRSLRGFEENIDLIVTSYGTLRSEKQALRGAIFEVAIFDEIQTAKNRLSQTHKALKGLSAKIRVGLTGTPIENHLTELKALFDLILPGYLPSDSAFREFFTIPIEKHGDATRSQMLTKMIAPFTLRRKKDDVLKDLPERIEEKALCELSAEQKKLYKEAFLKSRDQIMHEIEDDAAPIPYLHVFALLTTLKQICDHPALITKNLEEAHLFDQGKWALFVELLSEALQSGQKVVIFSQYLDMLAIMENYLKSQHVRYAQIKGSTRDRKKQLETFRDDPDCRVFLGSLQAAGTGIDLISASIVIHYDRWWNPAKEEQATARVHRMGQKRGVQVFKLVTKNSIEEHIDQLIERKKALSEIVAFDDQESLKTLDRNELLTLFAAISRDIS